MSINHQSVSSVSSAVGQVRCDWTIDEIKNLFEQPFNNLLFLAQSTHQLHFADNSIQISTLMNIKSGGCPEDCAYCPQSARYQTDITVQPLSSIAEVKQQASLAKDRGASRFCMGAAWRQPKAKDLEQVVDMVKVVKSLGLESCATLGMLNQEQADILKAAGLDFYNHNLDSSEEFYEQVIHTRNYQDRLRTLDHVREAGIALCCGGIMGMGEARTDRIAFLHTLATMSKHPESVPINRLVKVKGTPLDEIEEINAIEFVRVIAIARILMPKSYVRLSAGRNEMSEEMQALCFFAGANSIFYGEKLLTTDNPQCDTDQNLLERLGIQVNG